MPDLVPPHAAEPPQYPPHVAISAEVARRLDRAAEVEHGIPSFVLMEHAARGLATLVARLCPSDAEVVVLCGPGNNGGDGHGMARFLASWGRCVRRLQLSADLPRSPDARLEVALCGGALPPAGPWTASALIEAVGPQPGVVVDALFGVGVQGPLRPPYPELIEAINGSGHPVLAVDLPSGLHTDTGEPLPVAIRAQVTATMVAPKLGIAPGAAGAPYAGHVVELDIGLPRDLHAPYLASGAASGS